METETLQIALYDEITPEVIKDIVAALLEKPDADVMLRINSPGGEVTSGYALANALKSHAGRKIAVIDGLCASAATFPACACDEIHMHPESLFMVHGPWAEVSGGPEAMSAQGELLGKMADLCTGLYQRKTGADSTAVREWMSKDTWMTPAEAMAAGFCDKILSETAPAQARAAAQRYVARMRMPKAKNKDKAKMALPDEMKSKLAKFGLGDEESPEALQKAYQSYMSETEDGPEMRREMARAMADAGDNPANPVVKMEDDKEKDKEDSSSDKSKSLASKLNQSANTDPAVQKLLSKLTSRTSEMEGELADLRREKQVTAFAKAMQSRVDEETAREFLAATGWDEPKAKALVMKLPEQKKGSAMIRMTQGGDPVGGKHPAPGESEAAPIVNGGRHHLHGFALAKLAAQRAAKMTDKEGESAFEKYARAQREVLSERRDLFV